jgi:photosystem II stability/assembly factor-like uncharacterized protein
VKTKNDGKNWHLANLGLPNAGAGDSNLFQAIQVQGQNIYVGGRGGFWNSPDGGLTWNWTSSDSTLSTEIVKQLFALKDNTRVFVQGDFTNDYGVIHIGRDSNILKLQADGKLVKVRTDKPPYMIGMSSSDPATIYMLGGNVVDGMSGLVTGGASVMKSDDSGFSWETYDLARWLRPSVANCKVAGFPIMTVAYQSSKIVYVVVSLYDSNNSHKYALMQTLDGGATWRDIFPEKLMPAGFNYGGLGDISAVAIDPKDGRTIYLAFNGGVYRSGDGGAQWTQLPVKAGKINDITVSAQSSEVLYLAAETGVWVSRNGGITWTLGNIGPMQENVKSVISGSDLTLAQGANGIYRLTNSLSWASSKWKEWEEKPESDPIAFTAPATTISYESGGASSGNAPSSNRSPQYASPHTSSCGDFAACFQDGQKAAASADWQRAITSLESATSQDPSRANPWWYLGNVYLAVGQTNSFPAAWDNVMNLSRSLSIAVCRDRSFQYCEQGNLFLGTDKISFTGPNNHEVFSAPTSSVVMNGVTDTPQMGSVAFGIKAGGKKYSFEFRPVGVDCTYAVNVTCTQQGKEQQLAVANYVANTIPKLISGSLGTSSTPATEIPLLPLK